MFARYIKNGENFYARRANKTFKKSENMKKVQKYIEKYLDDLMFHFDLNEQELCLILNNESKNRNRKNTTKKWWNFFKMK
ncbi:MAG: hypothetical protein L6V95_00090 [Candidatus Melainabacteria bacterium]|nr:MAG: hypothetical protein L6V95_00090 [Candidatus Melainabacteria bacterium]